MIKNDKIYVIFKIEILNSTVIENLIAENLITKYKITNGITFELARLEMFNIIDELLINYNYISIEIKNLIHTYLVYIK